MYKAREFYIGDFSFRRETRDAIYSSAFNTIFVEYSKTPTYFRQLWSLRVIQAPVELASVTQTERNRITEQKNTVKREERRRKDEYRSKM